MFRDLVRICKYCKNEFKSRRRVAIFCSNSCSTSFKNVKRNKRHLYVDQIRELYVDKYLTLDEIVKLIPLSIGTIKTAIKDTGNKLRKRSDSYNLRRSKIPFTPLQEQLFFGSMLGDLYLQERHFIRRDTNTLSDRYAAIFSHSVKQLEYLMLKYKIINRHIKISDCISGHGAHMKRFTFVDKRLKQIADICLQSRQKHVTKRWLNKLDACGWAFFYQDDGTFDRCCSCAKFCTLSFTKDENQLIVDTLYKLGINAGVNVTRIRNGKRQYIVRIYKKDSIKFFDMISPWVIPSMAYKLNGRHCGSAILSYMSDNKTHVVNDR